jgi:hypothetical protein
MPKFILKLPRKKITVDGTGDICVDPFIEPEIELDIICELQKSRELVIGELSLSGMSIQFGEVTNFLLLDTLDQIPLDIKETVFHSFHQIVELCLRRDWDREFWVVLDLVQKSVLQHFEHGQS